MSELCKWLHNQLEQLPLIKFPNLDILPENGIYFFYEKGEAWGHGRKKPRIVRIGTSKDGNFSIRIKEHYLWNESKMNFDKNKPKPSDRSIFRKNIGRALLNSTSDKYLPTWEIDFTSRRKRERYRNQRKIKNEKRIEINITRILRKKFSFRFIILNNQLERIGSKGLESSLIGTVAKCELCRPSNNWIGIHSTKKQIKEGKLWLIQHLKATGIDEKDKDVILKAILKTKRWIKNRT